MSDRNVFVSRGTFKAWRAAKRQQYYARSAASRFGYVQRIREQKRSIPGATGEFKSKDSSDTNPANSTTRVVLLNGIARGDEISERNGREVVMRSVQLSCYMRAKAGATTPQIIRYVLFYDRQTNATAPAVTDLLQADAVNAMRNLENRRRFKIFMDKKVSVDGPSSGTGSHAWEFYRKLRHPVTFNSGDAGTVADITTGSLYLLITGTEAAGATDCQQYVRGRVRYTDK